MGTVFFLSPEESISYSKTFTVRTLAKDIICGIIGWTLPTVLGHGIMKAGKRLKRVGHCTL